MQTIVKIPRSLFEQAKADLHRRHRHAGERIGFFSTRCTRQKSTILVHCVAYSSVSDDDYVEDDSVGVRIGPKVITDAMTRSIQDSVGQIHVHSHGGHGLPHPSGTDWNELPPLLGSLRNANAGETHGWMILGNQDAWTSLSIDGSNLAVEEASVSLVGFPTVSNHRQAQPPSSGWRSWLPKLAKKGKAASRYDRQSFLGQDSESIIANTVVGIVGLGGGGSHIVQQMAHLGFRNYVLCDHDHITDTNLNRLVGGTRADAKARRQKTRIAERCIRALHLDANITIANTPWEETTDHLCGCDIVIGCLDTFSARRDLEAFCRRNLIPYIDVGMDVHKLDADRHEIYGQVILSMPGRACMHCLGFLNETVLAAEAQLYGAAGSKPQVVWSNGLLCSAATGIVVDLLTDWSRTCRGPIHHSFRGSSLTLGADNRLATVENVICPHYPFTSLGDAASTPL